MPFVASAVGAFRAVHLARKKFIHPAYVVNYANYVSGVWGDGAGKGGGSGGAVREAGGTFGKMEAAREEEYFKKLQRKQLLKLKQHIKEEISHHEKLINQHKEAIARHVERINELKREGQKTVESAQQSLEKETG